MSEQACTDSLPLVCCADVCVANQSHVLDRLNPHDAAQIAVLFFAPELDAVFDALESCAEALQEPQ